MRVCTRLGTDRRPRLLDHLLEGPQKGTLLQETRSDPPRAALVALVASGALGFHLGYTRFPDWQIPVESAQVLAGLVVYPHETPFYVHHMKLWTLLHQVCAVFLKAGVSEIELSKLVSGMLGMLSLQALTMFSFAFCRRALLSVGFALLLFVSGVTYAGALYPIFLMGAPFTYGIVGLSLIVLVAGLLGSGLHRTGAFLLGLAPAVHTGLALWLWVIVGCCFIIERGRGVPRGSLRSLLAGIAVTGVSFAVHSWMSAGVPSQPVAMDRHYLDAFVAFWDGHRRPVSLRELAVLLNVAALGLATAWLRWFRLHVTEEAAWLLRFAQVSAAMSIALVPLTWVPPAHVPVPLLVLMPGRVLNIVAMTFSAMLLGLLGRSAIGWQSLLMLAMTAALFIGNDSMLWRMLPTTWPESWPHVPTDAIAFVVAAALLIGMVVQAWRSRQSPVQVRLQIPTSRAVGIANLLLLLASAVVAYRAPEPRGHIFIDRTNNSVLAAAAGAPGLLLTVGDAHLMQLRTRRPMLIDTGALDTIPYTPGSGPVLDRILRDIYGIDLFAPPPELRGAGRLLEDVHREHWQRYSAEDWRRIRKDYHVTQVLTPSDWQLDLPIVAGDLRFLLHTIPE